MTKQKRNVTGFFRLRRQNDEHGGRDDMVKEYVTGFFRLRRQNDEHGGRDDMVKEYLTGFIRLRRQNDGREAGMTSLFHFD